MVKHIGILTAGGDSPGLNAAIRGVGKSANMQKIEVIGFRDGFRGLVDNRKVILSGGVLSGILTIGGTILGTSRDKPHKMEVSGKTRDMTDTIVENYHSNHLDVLVCLGGGGTHKNALKLINKGLNVITLPKTIDNDVAKTDVTFGFHTALDIATEAVDRLHSTAHSHHRIILVEIMGHRAGWLTLGAGIAGGADVVLIPELPYDIENVAETIRNRASKGKNFSIVAVAEGALSKQDFAIKTRLENQKSAASSKEEKQKIKAQINDFEEHHQGNTYVIARQLEELTGLETRVTILGHVQRGGTPSAMDRLLSTRLGTACVELINKSEFNVMVAARGDSFKPVPIEDVAGKRKLVPADHPLIVSARAVGTGFGD